MRASRRRFLLVSAFGAAGAGFLRLAYTQGEADLRKGLERMGEYLYRHRP